MGDRVSISFRNGNEESVTLFSHWGGKPFVVEAFNYIQTLPTGRTVMPLDRCEPNTIMVDFIRHLTKGQDRVESNLYLGAHSEDGDNSDNGHFTLDLLDDGCNSFPLGLTTR